MNSIRKKLVHNDLPSIDFYDDSGKWIACIYEFYAGSWSVRFNRVELLSCYYSEAEAFDALSFWVDFEPLYIPD